MPPTTSTSTSTTTSTTSSSTSTTTTICWFTISEYELLTGDSYTGEADVFYDLVQDIGDDLEDKTGVIFCEREMTEQIIASYVPYARSDSEFRPREFSGLHIALRVRCSKKPVSVVNSIAIKEKGQTLALTFGDADLREALGIIYCPTSTGKLGEHVLVEIQYTVGLGAPPRNAKMAVALLVQEWLLAESLAAQGSQGWILRFRSGDYSETRMLWSTKETKVGLGTQLSKRAQLLLRPWLGKIRLS